MPDENDLQRLFVYQVTLNAQRHPGKEHITVAVRHGCVRWTLELKTRLRGLVSHSRTGG